MPAPALLGVFLCLQAKAAWHKVATIQFHQTPQVQEPNPFDPLTDPTAEFAQFYRPKAFDGLELLAAHYHAHEFSPHVHEGYAIALIEQGVERYRYRGSQHLAGAGDLAIVNPYEVHTGARGVEQGWSYRVFYPDIASMNTLAGEMGLPQTGTPSFPPGAIRDAQLTQHLLALHLCMTDSSTRLEQESRWRDAMGLLIQRYADRGHAAPVKAKETWAVRCVREMLDESSLEDLGLEALAGAVGLSPWYLNRVFSRTVGMPPHAYQNQLRLNRAKSLLRTQLPLAELASRLGFADQAHFTRQFKRAFGLTPGRYRQAAD